VQVQCVIKVLEKFNKKAYFILSAAVTN